MSEKKSLSMKFAFDELFVSLGRLVGYGGFHFSELAGKMKPLVAEHGAKKVSAALFEIYSFEGWVVTLNKQARKAAWQLLGPSPDRWDSFYRQPNGTPMERPPGKETPPEIPKPEPDPMLDQFCRLASVDLDRLLKDARKKQHSSKDYEAELAKEQIPRLESEMVRRGQEIPPEEQEPQRPAKKPKRAKPKPSTNGTPEKPQEPEEPMRQLTDDQLTQQLQLARSILTFSKPDSVAGRQAQDLADEVEAEMRRRDMEIPVA